MSIFAFDAITDGIVLGGGSAPTIAAANQLSRVGMNPRGEFRSVQPLQYDAELHRQGVKYSFASDSAVVDVANALPTTTASFQVINNYPVGGRHFIFDVIAWVCDTDTAAAAQHFELLYQIQAANAPVTATIDTNTAVKNLFYGLKLPVYGNAIFSKTVTLGGNEVWSPLGNDFTTALTAPVGFGVYVKCQGEIVLAPQKAIAFALVSDSALTKGTMYYEWSEVQLT